MDIKSKFSPSNLYIYFLTLYLILSVVNWLPVISIGLIRGVKYILFIFIFFYELKYHSFKFPSFYLSPIGLLLVLMSMSFGLYLSPNISSFVDILLPFLIIWIFNFKKNTYYKVILNASLIIAFICFLSIISNFTGIYNIEPNGPWSSTFGKAAFGGYSTGYSNSLFLFVPFLVFWHRKENKGFFSKETFAIITIIIAQYIAGGRAGLLASLLIFFLGYKFSIVYKLIIVIMLIPLIQSEEFLIQMRIVNVYGDEIDEDRISSGRIELGTYYLDKFYERPFFGYGFGEKEEIDANHDVHIVWLKNAINGGFFYVLFLLGIFLSIFITVLLNSFFLSKEEMWLFLSIFFISFLITFLEPNYLIGSVQGEFVYWLIISLMMKKQIDNNVLDENSLVYEG